MPLVHVSIAKGNSKEVLLKIMDSVMNSVQEILQLPSDDKNIRLSEFEPDFFRTKAPYKIIIEISLFSGRTAETKKKLFKKLVSEIENYSSFKANEVFILLNEQPRENWGIRGGIPGNEVDLGFKVEI